MGTWGAGNWTWFVSGAAVVLLALAVFVWAMFWDRSRGRRRCPRCWYDMSGASGLTCPECGKTARRERLLRKTRRRKWIGAFMGVLILAGTASIAWPFRVEITAWWWKNAPDAVLIDQFARWDRKDDPLASYDGAHAFLDRFAPMDAPTFEPDALSPRQTRAVIRAARGNVLDQNLNRRVRGISAALIVAAVHEPDYRDEVIVELIGHDCESCSYIMENLGSGHVGLGVPAGMAETLLDVALDPGCTECAWNAGIALGRIQPLPIEAIVRLASELPDDESGDEVWEGARYKLTIEDSDYPQDPEGPENPKYAIDPGERAAVIQALLRSESDAARRRGASMTESPW